MSITFYWAVLTTVLNQKPDTVWQHALTLCINRTGWCVQLSQKKDKNIHSLSFREVILSQFYMMLLSLETVAKLMFRYEVYWRVNQQLNPFIKATWDKTKSHTSKNLLEKPWMCPQIRKLQQIQVMAGSLYVNCDGCLQRRTIIVPEFFQNCLNLKVSRSDCLTHLLFYRIRTADRVQ